MTATIGEIAASYGISRNHLMKVVHELGVAGYLETARGKNGGLRLARAAREVVLGEVVRRMEPDMALVPCFDRANSPCVITPVCTLRRALHDRSAGTVVVRVPRAEQSAAQSVKSGETNDSVNSR